MLFGKRRLFYILGIIIILLIFLVRNYRFCIAIPVYNECHKALKGIYTLVLIYEEDKMSKLPPPILLKEYIQKNFPGGYYPGMFYCSKRLCERIRCSDIFGNLVLEKIEASYPKELDHEYVFHDSLPISNSSIYIYCPNSEHHNGYFPTLFADGSVRRVSKKDFLALLKKQKEILGEKGIFISFPPREKQ